MLAKTRWRSRRRRFSLQ